MTDLRTLELLQTNACQTTYRYYTYLLLLSILYIVCHGKSLITVSQHFSLTRKSKMKSVLVTEIQSIDGSQLMIRVN